MRRQAREADARAWAVGHLMWSTGHFGKDTRVSQIIRDLLGREPGTVPGQLEASRRAVDAEPTPEAFVEWLGLYVRAHGGKDLRPEVTG